MQSQQTPEGGGFHLNERKARYAGKKDLHVGWKPAGHVSLGRLGGIAVGLVQRGKKSYRIARGMQSVTDRSRGGGGFTAGKKHKLVGVLREEMKEGGKDPQRIQIQ